jgi:hypothetical protein
MEENLNRRAKLNSYNLLCNFATVANVTFKKINVTSYLECGQLRCKYVKK